MGGVFIKFSPANGEVASRCTVSATLNISVEMVVASSVAEMHVLVPAYLVSTVSFGRTR